MDESMMLLAMAAFSALLLVAVLLLLVRRGGDPGASVLRERAVTAEREAAARIAVLESQLSAAAERAADLDRRLQAATEPAREVDRLRVETSHQQRRINELEAAGETLRGELAGSREAAQKALADNAALGKELAAARRQLEEQRQWVTEQTEHFRDLVAKQTAEMMEQRADQFRKLNADSVGQLLAPLKGSLESFSKEVKDFARVQGQERQGLKSQIETLVSLNTGLKGQTEALTNALTTRSKAQGDWGETQLMRLLELAGLKEGVNFHVQATVEAVDSSRRQRPDVIVDLPEDRQVVIDSKVSLTAWTEFHNAETDDARKLALKAHVASLRQHVKDLSGRRYSESPDIHTLDFVVMFVPIEGAMLEALHQDPGLYTDAVNSNVIITGPTMLHALLRLINNLWNMHRQEEHAQAVLEQGAKIHHKLMNFAESFEEVGSRLESAHEFFGRARGQLLEGRGNAIKLLADLEALGVKTRKSLPQSMQRALDESADATDGGDGQDAG